MPTTANWQHPRQEKSMEEILRTESTRREQRCPHPDFRLPASGPESESVASGHPLGGHWSGQPSETDAVLLSAR